MKIWTVATDTQFGTETHTFLTEEDFDNFMHGLLEERWHSDDDMPDDWSDAWEAMGCVLGDLDTFSTGEIELFDHPAVLEALQGLRLGVERMTMNDYGGEEKPYIAEIEAIIAKLTPPKPPEQAVA